MSFRPPALDTPNAVELTLYAGAMNMLHQYDVHLPKVEVPELCEYYHFPKAINGTMEALSAASTFLFKEYPLHANKIVDDVTHFSKKERSFYEGYLCAYNAHVSELAAMARGNLNLRERERILRAHNLSEKYLNNSVDFKNHEYLQNLADCIVLTNCDLPKNEYIRGPTL